MSKQEEVKTKEEEVKITATDTTPTKKEGEFKIKSAKKMKNLGEEKIPDIYWVTVTSKKLDKKRILSDLKEGKEIKGVRLKKNDFITGLK